MASTTPTSKHHGGFYATKLAGPSLPPGMVSRPRLVKLLDAGRGCALTLVSAPAGSGKTTALAGWMRRTSTARVAWLSLDRRDGDRLRFWIEAIAALQQVAPELTGFDLHDPADDSFLPSLVNALAELDEPLTLVLDDFQDSSSTEVVDDLEVLLEHLPEGFRLVISTRSDPPLRLQRLRLAGRLSELRARDLAFSESEARMLVRSIKVTLDDADSELLWRRTEGWAAGLRLAALSLQDHPNPTAFVAGFAGSDHAVSDYLLREVIARQPPEMLDLLLRTSILDQVTPSLADALTDRNDTDRAIDVLAYRDGLASALEQRPGWYRLHGLLIEALRVELRRRFPEEVPALHRRAARWHADHGFPAEAERHALAAGENGSKSDTANVELREPLSERELAVLRFLPTMLSNAEIAAELYVSVNTVKTHVKHVYRKLDAHDRRTAVQRARELCLLGSSLRRQ